MASGEATLLLRIKEVGQSILDRFVITLGDVIDIAKGVASALYSTVEAFREEELAINELSQAMIQSGTFTGELRAKYIEMASALQQLTTYGDEQIISAQAILQTHIGNREVTEDLVKATLDLAAAKKMDLSAAADLVGKAITSENDILSRHGIHVRAATDENQKMANVIEAVSSKFDGRAAAMAKDLGVIDQLKNTWSDFLEKIGALIGPTVEALASGANAAIKFFTAMMPSTFDASKATADQLNQKILELRRNIINLQESSAGREGMKAFDQARIAAWEEDIKKHKEYLDKLEADKKAAGERNLQLTKEENIRATEERFAQQIRDQDATIVEQQMQAMNDEQKLAAKVAQLDKEIAAEENFLTKQQMIKDRANLIAQQKDAIVKAQRLKFEQAYQAGVVSVIQAGANLATAVGDQNSKAVFLIQKAAAIAGAIVATNLAMAQAMATPPGPPYTMPLVAMAKAAGYMNVAAIGATTIKGLATGGIVKAQPGGAPFIIGEGGRDEAVIPLEDGRVPGMGGGVTININGPFMGDETQARQLAKMIDEQMFHLRRNNESMAFDSGVL